MYNFRRTFSGILVLFVFLCVQAASAQKGKLDITYTVELSEPARRQFHITTDIKNISSPRLDLALPTWTPGWYVVENYGKNLLRFKITDGEGRRLPFKLTKKQTWSVETKGIGEIRVEYDYLATILALNQAKIADDFAFFTGIELFLEPLGHRETPSNVRLRTPAGWRIVTALKETPDPMTFSAPDYDALVDSPVLMGRFDSTWFEIDGKPHYLVTTPAGLFSREKTHKYIEMLTKVAEEQKKIFGGLPYEKFVYFYFLTPPESNASGALEHANSFVAFAPGGENSNPEQLITTGAHEFFHLWNVKRFRPAEMWPYDYSREQETPLLWVSEGFTNYYANLTIMRAGLISEEQFLGRAAGAISGVENNEARNYIAPANSSVSTWVGYDSPVAFSISYYTAGQNLAALLDLSIRNDTDGNRGLDDVMRALFNEHYKQGKGFTSDDLLKIINRLTKKDYSGFFAKYVYGVEVPDYDTFFGYAGLQVNQKIEQAPVFGFNIRNRGGGFLINSIEPNSPAANAGLRVGDLIVKVNSERAQAAEWNNFAGQTIKLTVIRGGVSGNGLGESEIQMAVGSREFTSFSLSDAANITARQRMIRESWLKQEAK